jgi:ATP/ADP translocase
MVIMAMSRLRKILSRVVEIKPGEELISLQIFFYFFCITAPWTIVKSLRDASYLEDLGASNLPYAYATAILVGLAVDLHSKIMVRISRYSLIVSTLAFFILTSFLFLFLFSFRWKWLALAYWLWANLMVVVLITQFWILVNDIYNSREAKRLIGFFGSGGILGGIAGGLMTGMLASSSQPQRLLLLSSGFLIAGALTAHFLFRRLRSGQVPPVKVPVRKEESKPRTSPVGFRICWNTVKHDPYLRLLATIVVVTIIVSTFIDFQSKSIFEAEPSIRKNLASFFGFFNAGLQGFAFLLQILVTSPLIRRFGLRLTLLVYPLVLLLASFGIALWPVAFFAIMIKGSDKSLSYSINQSSRELLFLPVAPDLKYRAKIFIDMFLNRFSKGLGAVILLAALAIVPPAIKIRAVSLLSVLFILLWIYLNRRASREYVKTVKQKLKVEKGRAEALVGETLDVDQAKLFLDALESQRRSDVLFALNIYDLVGQNKLTPEMKQQFSRAERDAGLSSLGSLLEAEEVPLISEPEPVLSDELLKKEVREVFSLDVYQEVMSKYADGLLAEKSPDAETSRMEMAKAIGFMNPHSRLARKLDELIDDASAEVGRYAIESAGKLLQRDHVPALIAKLESPLLRGDATAALARFGTRVAGTLADYLADLEESEELRKAAASLLGLIGTQEASDFLVWDLSQGRGRIERQIIDGLDRIRSEKHDIRFSEELIRPVLARKINEYCQLFLKIHEAPPEGRALDFQKNAPEKDSLQGQIFQLLGLIYARSDISRAYQNIRAHTKEAVAYALELLDNTLRKEDKDFLFPLIEELPLEERLSRFKKMIAELDVRSE